MTRPDCLRLTPSQAQQAFGPHGHVQGLYVLLDPPKPGGTLWAISRAEAKGTGAGGGGREEATGTSIAGSSQSVAGSTDRFAGSSEWFAGLTERPRQALIVQDCAVRGAAEWDVANRATAAGIVEQTRVIGSRILMHCRTGARKIRFGPSSTQLGAQALESIVPETGDEPQEQAQEENQARLRLRGRGLAGAGVGLAHGLARAPNVLWTDYPEVSADEGIAGLKAGGGHEVTVETVVPVLTRLMVGLDDTDTRETGATWVLGLELARHLESTIPDLSVLDHRLIQLWPGIQEKTSNCVALALSLALPPHQVPKAREAILDHVAANSASPEAAVALYEGIQVPHQLTDLTHTARRERVTLEDVTKIARANRVVLEPVVGSRGLIGATAALGGLDLGPDMAAPATGVH